MTISEILESLVSKVVSENNIPIGLAIVDQIEYSIISWDWHDDDHTIDLLYNGTFKLYLATWNEDGENVSSVQDLNIEDAGIIPLGLKNLMKDVYVTKESTTFKADQLLCVPTPY